jgi:hypothetical protein
VSSWPKIPPWSAPGSHTDEGLRAAIAIGRDQPGTGILVFSQYVETRYAADLLGMRPGGVAAGVGYVLKDRVANVAEFTDALSRVAAGGTALDPEVVTDLLTASRHGSALAGLSGRELDVLALMAEGRPNLTYWETHPRPTEAYWQGEDTRIGYGRALNPRRRMTTEEQEWRDRYDSIKWAIEQEVAA